VTSADSVPPRRPHKSADGAPGKQSDGNDLPVGGRVRVSRLDTLAHVRAELGRLYREARQRAGRYPDSLTAARLASILGQVRTAIEVEELEQRVAALERREILA